MASYLIVGPSWIGDIVMAQSLFISLRQRDPAACIDVLSPPWSLPILARMPEIRRAISLATAHGEWGLVKRWRLGRALRDEGYDKAIVLPRSWKSALVPFFAGIAMRVGFRGEQRYGLLTECRVLDKHTLDQTVKRFVSLGLPDATAYPPLSIPAPRLRVDADNSADLYRRFGLPPAMRAAAIMPGAEYGPSKQWPPAYFRQVAEYLLAKGYQIWILGGAADCTDAVTIADGLRGAVYNLCGKTRLIDAIDLLAAARLAVCNDSGLMHIAAAVGTDIHALYGSSSATFTPPLSTRATCHSLALPCAPCFRRRCRFGHYDCLRKIEPHQVINRLL